MVPSTLTFDHVVSSQEELVAILGRPNYRVSDKVLPALDEHCTKFIASAPFVVVASYDAAGRLDLSPKGDPAGFVAVLDQHTLAIPHRPGNRREDTFRNVLQNPRVGLIFLIPSKGETLRVSGSARIVRDRGLRESLAMNGKAPEVALVVTVEEAFLHCSKCMIRSKLWEPASWASVDHLASLAEAMIAHAKLADTVGDMQAIIENDARTRLY
jgi:PPOX class probable FMN-dependent enzyme